MCDSSSVSPAFESVSPADVAVYSIRPIPLLDPVVADLASYLGTSWGSSVTVARAVPDFTAKRTIWLSTSAAAMAKAGVTITSGYAIERASGADSIVVYAPDVADLAFGAYALLEELGIRFFHPLEELVPRRGSAALPLTLDVQRAPLVQQRGLQFHTLHPIEYLAVFNEPSSANLADAQKVIDWLVKTGQNYVQWALLSTVDFATWAPYAQSIVTYAHSRGVRVGCVVQLWAGAALQNNYDLVTDATSWQIGHGHPARAADASPVGRRRHRARRVQGHRPGLRRDLALVRHVAARDDEPGGPGERAEPRRRLPAALGPVRRARRSSTTSSRSSPIRASG